MDSGKSIIELVKSAGLYVGTNISGVTLVGGSPSNNKLIVHLEIDELERFAALVRAQALEEAAGVCERLPMQQEIDVRDECAAAIRQLKETK